MKGLITAALGPRSAGGFGFGMPGELPRTKPQPLWDVRDWDEDYEFKRNNEITNFKNHSKPAFLMIYPTSDGKLPQGGLRVSAKVHERDRGTRDKGDNLPREDIMRGGFELRIKDGRFDHPEGEYSLMASYMPKGVGHRNKLKITVDIRELPTGFASVVR